MTKLIVLVPVLLVAIFVQQGESVRCWTCSSDLDPTCNDPFLPSRADNPNRYILTNCDANAAASYPYLTSSKSVCKKHKIYVNGELRIHRGCTWKRADDFSNVCPSTSNSRQETTTFCETCEYDGCNSATSIGKTVALLVAPLGLLLFK